MLDSLNRGAGMLCVITGLKSDTQEMNKTITKIEYCESVLIEGSTVFCFSFLATHTLCLSFSLHLPCCLLQNLNCQSKILLEKWLNPVEFNKMSRYIFFIICSDCHYHTDVGSRRQEEPQKGSSNWDSCIVSPQQYEAGSLTKEKIKKWVRLIFDCIRNKWQPNLSNLILTPPP